MTNSALPEQSPWIAWRNALAITALGCLLLGYGCFVVLGRFLSARLPLFAAAAWQQVGFTLALGVIFAVIVYWQRRRGMSLADLGWHRPANKLSYALAIALGALYVTGSYFGAREVLPRTNVLEINWVRLALAPLGIFMAAAEETMMRGFFMTELRRAGVATWIQILASGACSAVYHALQNPTLLGFVPSFVLFSLHAGLYVFAGRSLGPPIVAHAIYHVLGEPYLLMMVLATMAR